MVKISSVALDSNRNLTPSNQDRTDKRTLSGVNRSRRSQGVARLFLCHRTIGVDARGFRPDNDGEESSVELRQVGLGVRGCTLGWSSAIAGGAPLCMCT